jgi:hypothetical protein
MTQGSFKRMTLRGAPTAAPARGTAGRTLAKLKPDGDGNLARKNLWQCSDDITYPVIKELA